MQKTELHEYENSESYVRLKTLQMMKEQGMRGRPNGYNKRGIQQFYAVNIEHMHREIIKRYEPKFTIVSDGNRIPIETYGAFERP